MDWGRFDACIVRSTWDYHDKHSEFLAWTREVAAETRLWNPPALIAWNSEKTYLRDQSEGGVPIVPTVWVDREDGADLDDVLESEGWEEAIVKPVVDLGARNLKRTRAGAGPAPLEVLLQRGSVMEQPFLRDDSKTIKQLLAEVVAGVGESIEIRRFARFALGEVTDENSGGGE